MSLLLDALKRAEQEKSARQGEREGAGLHLAAAKPALELQPAPPIAPPAANPSRSASQAAIEAIAPRPASRKRAFLWLAVGAVTLLVAAAVGYVWYAIAELQPKTVARVAAPRPIAPMTPIARAEPPPPPVAQASAEARTSAAATPAPAVGAATPALAAAAKKREVPASAPAPASVLQPTRAADRARVPAEVASGYEALRRGDLAEARRNYQAAAAADAANIDAILGLATIEARGGNRAAASAHYRRALDIDPRNATALAGLAALMDFSRADLLEPQLVRDISHHPESAALHYMLGNLYAAQSRWSQAQSAYFEAHRLEPGNAEILHNLAVSLDQLGQARTAAPYYRRALEAARTQGAAFDAAAVTRRLAEIEGTR